MEKFLFVLRRLEPKQVVGLLLALGIVTFLVVMGGFQIQGAAQRQPAANARASQAPQSPTPDLGPVASPTGLTANDETAVEYCEAFVASAIKLDPDILTFTKMRVELWLEDYVEHKGESYDQYAVDGYVNHIEFRCTLLIGGDGFVKIIDADSVTVEVGGIEY